MYIVIFITCSDKKEAGRIAGALVKNKLAACVNIIENIKSIFWWETKVDKACESLLVVKSKRAKLTKVMQLVESLHSYQVPEIIALPILAGNKDYLRWIDESIRKSH
jgi:periplasmic divalent cation tolerance protein